MRTWTAFTREGCFLYNGLFDWAQNVLEHVVFRLLRLCARQRLREATALEEILLVSRQVGVQLIAIAQADVSAVQELTDVLMLIQADVSSSCLPSMNAPWLSLSTTKWMHRTPTPCELP